MFVYFFHSIMVKSPNSKQVDLGLILTAPLTIAEAL